MILKSGKIVKTDLVIVAAGGLETPLLVAKLSKLGGGDFCKTLTYEDHISVFLARVKLQQSLRSSCRLGSGWSARRAMIGGNSNNPVAFYFKPTLNLAWSRVSAEDSFKSAKEWAQSSPCNFKTHYPSVGVDRGIDFKIWDFNEITDIRNFCSRKSPSLKRGQ